MNNRFYLLFPGLLLFLILTSCSKDEDEDIKADTEQITEVTLLFSPFDGGPPLLFVAAASEGESSGELVPEGEIVLEPNTTYDLFIQLENESQNIGDEIDTEGTDHMFFFGFTEGLFITPMGDGNIDERTADAVVYGDSDTNGQPIGLITSWATASAGSGTFRVLLQHQEDGIKSEVSTAEDGATDLDITWDITVAL